MLAGDPFKRSYTSDFAGQAISFMCLDYDNGSEQYSALPNKTCPGGLRAQVFFPSCWDGVNLDSSDHKSHMAYPTEYSYDNGPCPASHPVHMISVFYEVLYSTDGFEWWNGTQQPFVFAMGDPTGYGLHGDFLNGWDVDVLQNATDNCNDASGVMELCDVFDFFTTEESESCIIAPQVNEQVSGTLDALPGCNPVTWGPEEAPSSYANCPVTSISAAAVYYTNVTGWDYLGCGFDSSTTGRTFNGSSFSSSSMTVESCLSFCKGKGYHYAGLEYEDECYCGNSLPADQAPVPGILGNCIMPCAGNSSEYCGGSARLSMYHTDTVATVVSCPASNGTVTTTTTGANFTVDCGMDYSGANINMVYTSNGITGCMESCANVTNCVAASLSGTACYLKSALGTATLNSAVNAVRLVAAGSSVSSSSSSTVLSSKTSTLISSSTSSTSSSSVASSSSSSISTLKTSILASTSSTSTKTTTTSSSTAASSTSSVPLCPNLNSTVYTDTATGYKFTIECGIDHAGGDLSMVYVQNLAGCIAACAKTTSCVDVSLSGAACYMKKSVGAPVYSNSGILGARLIVASSSTAAMKPRAAGATDANSSPSAHTTLLKMATVVKKAAVEAEATAAK